MIDKTYDLFISSSHKDRKWVSEFVTVLRKEGFLPWSTLEMAPGENWAESLEKALHDSTTLIMVLSPEILKSNSMFFELGAAIAGKKQIIPVIIKDLEGSQIPPIMLRYQCLNEPSPSIAGKRVAEVVSKNEHVEA